MHRNLPPIITLRPELLTVCFNLPTSSSREKRGRKKGKRMPSPVRATTYHVIVYRGLYNSELPSSGYFTFLRPLKTYNERRGRLSGKIKIVIALLNPNSALQNAVDAVAFHATKGKCVSSPPWEIISKRVRKRWRIRRVAKKVKSLATQILGVLDCREKYFRTLFNNY